MRSLTEQDIGTSTSLILIRKGKFGTDK